MHSSRSSGIPGSAGIPPPPRAPVPRGPPPYALIVSPVLLSLLVGLLAAAAGMGAAAVRARQLDKVAVVDVAWGAGFVLIAVAVAVLATAIDEGTAWRSWLAAGLVAVWGLRLAWHIRGRAVGEHGGKEDPRYAEMLG